MMTDYLLLLAATLMFTGQFAFTKVYGDTVLQCLDTTLPMLVGINLIGSVMYLCLGGFPTAFPPVGWLLAIAFALVMVPYYVLGIKVLSLGSLAVYSMFMMLGGMLLPFAYGVLFLKETVTLGKAVGLLFLSAAICLQAVIQKRGEQATDKRKRFLFFLLCIAIFILNGLTGVIAKAYEIADPAATAAAFTVISCAATAGLSLLLLIPRAVKNKSALARQVRGMWTPSTLLLVAAIGITTHTGNFLHLKAAAHLPASVQFPMVSGGVIVFSALASLFIFRERISKREGVCVAIACASTVLFAF